MIYKVTDGDVFEDNPGLDSNEKFAKCTSRELKYIFLLYDFKSPYSKMSFNMRQEKAGIEAGFRKEKDGKRFDKNARQVISTTPTARVKAAIAEFKAIQSASNKDLAILAAIDEQIEYIIGYLDNPTPAGESKSQPDRIKKNIDIMQKLPQLLEVRKKIEVILELAAAEEEGSTKEVSTLDEVNQEIIDNG